MYKRDVSASKHPVAIGHGSGRPGKFAMPRSGSRWNLVVPMQDDRFQYGSLTKPPATAARTARADATNPVKNPIRFVATQLIPNAASIG